MDEVAVRAASRALTAKQVRELLLSASPVPDPEVSGPAMADAYRLDDGGSLLVFEDGKGRRYASRDELLAMLDRVARQAPSSPLAELLPQGRSFPSDVPQLLAELGPMELSDVDGLIRRLGPAACLAPPMFGRLVAAVGEAIRAVLGGSWELAVAADGITWEPWVVDTSGRRHAPFALVLKELAEWGPDSSLYGAVRGHLRA
jgi:hypothetical protein